MDRYETTKPEEEDGGGALKRLVQVSVMRTSFAQKPFDRSGQCGREVFKLEKLVDDGLLPIRLEVE
jgi:hypothetical protein